MPTNGTVYEINLDITPCDGSVYVRSKDVPGLHLCGNSFKTMKPTVEKAIKRLFRDNRRINVNVVWVEPVATLKPTSAAAAEPPRKIAVYLAKAA